MAQRTSQAWLASGARTTSQTSPDFSALGANAIRVIVDVTAHAATPSVVLTIQGKDVISGKYYTLLAGTAITDVTGDITYEYLVFPGAAVTAGVSANKFMPDTFRLTMTAGDSDSLTYSVNFELADC